MTNKPPEISDRIHIMYISAFSQWGGSTISLMRRIEKLISKKYRITVVVPEDGPMVEKYREVGAEVKIIPFCVLSRFETCYQVLRYLIDFLPSVFRLYRLIKKADIELVHSNDSIILVSGIAAKLAKLPSITHIRDDINEPGWVVGLRNLIINVFSNKILAVSGAVLDNYIAYGGNSNKSEVLYNGIDLEVFKPNFNGNTVREKFGISEKAKVISLIARVDPNKGQDCLIFAADLVLKSHKSTFFLLVGDNNCDKFEWYKEKIMKLIGEKDLHEHLILTGRQDNIVEIINASDIIVLTSLYEAHPGVVCESSACGKPVVASGVGGIPEVVIDGKTGYLIPPQDVQALSERLIHLLSDKDCAEKMGTMGRKYMNDQFDINETTLKLEMIYMSFIFRN